MNWGMGAAYPIDGRMTLLFTVALAAAADTDRILEDLELLTGEQPMLGAEITSRAIQHPDLAKVRDWLEIRFTEIGLEVGTQTFKAKGQSCTNVWGELPGKDPNLPLIIVGAHYDSTGKSTPDWDAASDPAPGADDDASGVAAMLEAARLLSQSDYLHTIRFAAFSAEEVGLVGSQNMADALQDEGREVAMMLSLDPVGFDADDLDRLWVVYDPRWPDLAVEMEASARSLDIVAVDRDLIGGGERSDHAPFWLAGVPALHLATFPQPAEYHTVNDTLDIVDLESVTDVTDLVVRHIGELAIEQVPQQEPQRACACGSSALTASWLLPLIAVGVRRRKLA
jgi:hypothetical protein